MSTLNLTRDELCAHLALLGWVPYRGILDHCIYNVVTGRALRPAGAPGAYKWSDSVPPLNNPIDWDQLPEFYGRMLQYAADHHEALERAHDR